MLLIEFKETMAKAIAETKEAVLDRTYIESAAHVHKWFDQHLSVALDNACRSLEQTIFEIVNSEFDQLIKTIKLIKGDRTS